MTTNFCQYFFDGLFFVFVEAHGSHVINPRTRLQPFGRIFNFFLDMAEGIGTMTEMSSPGEKSRGRDVETATLGFPCPVELQERIDRYARQTDRSRSEVIRVAIRLGLADMEQWHKNKK